MRWEKVFYASLFLILGAGIAAWAEGEDVEVTSAQARSLTNPEWQSTIDQITNQTQALRTENEKLSSEYEFLQDKVSGLKMDLEKTKAQIKDLRGKKQSAKKLPVESLEQDNGALTKMSDLQKELDALESENKDLEQQLADIQEKNRLWKIQVSMLENKKRDANLDARYKETKDAEGDVVVKDAATDLQAQLDRSLQNEKDLAQVLDKMTTQNESWPREAADLKKKNRDLAQRLKVLKRQIAEQQKQNEKIQKTVKKVKSNPKGVAADLAKQKKSLEAEVAKLSAQLDAVSKTVGESREVLEKKRQMMDQIMHLDAENQELRSKIDAFVATSVAPE